MRRGGPSPSPQGRGRRGRLFPAGKELRPHLAGMERGRATGFAQGTYYAAAGAWPLLHLRSFEAVSGPKRDEWLVKTVGSLALAIGATMLGASRQRGSEPFLRLLGTSSALAFAAIDVWYVARRTISPVYLLDAAAEIALVFAWLTRSAEIPCRSSS